MAKVQINNTVRDATAEEENQMAIDIETSATDKTARDNAKAEKDTLKASAKTKLMSGEALTEEEADTIVL
tara:strand:- start:424 stop:633 length:210 start_codon:yes stop_codon:yes gene_type:complete